MSNPAVIILLVLLTLVSIALIVLVMMQEGDEKGLSGSIAGGYAGDTYMSHNQGRTREGKLKKYTRILLIAFIVISLAINIILAHLS